MDTNKRIVDKPWGFEEIWAETPSYVGKVLTIMGGHKLSRQYHVQKDETFRVMKGIIDLEIGDPAAGEVKIHRMATGDTYHCPPGTVHRMHALINSTVLEVSTNHLDDVVRLEDSYGRVEVKSEDLSQ